MPRFRFVPKPQSAAPAKPFASAEEAWFWFARAAKARRDGARFAGGPGSWQRPCDPDDIRRVLTALYRRGAVNTIHVATLARFGAAERPPDIRCEEELVFIAPWDEALDRLATPLKAKGIVE
ncbi:MAG: hypothetical protein AAB223_01995 [Pseudomonadota bacterium]